VLSTSDPNEKTRIEGRRVDRHRDRRAQGHPHRGRAGRDHRTPPRRQDRPGTPARPLRAAALGQRPARSTGLGDRGLPQLQRHTRAVADRPRRTGPARPAQAVQQPAQDDASFGKSDTIDATAAALAAIRVPDLPEAKPHDQTRELRLLADHRDDLFQENTRYQRRLRQHVHEIDPDLAPALRGLNSQTNLDRLARQLANRPQTAQVAIARELIRRIRELAKRTRQLHTEITRLVQARCPQLLEIEGCGPITAARIYAEVDGIDRFKNERHLASYAGIAPLDASSGRQQRHRLNRTGNRRLNRALHTIAVTQLRIHPPARAYIARRITEGKTNREALRALKRHLIRRLYNQLRNPDTSLAT
jgi:transposase